MTKRFYVVSADHVSAEYAADRKIVEVGEDGDRGFFASAYPYGCGRTYPTPEAAIRGLLGASACSNIRVDRVLPSTEEIEAVVRRAATERRAACGDAFATAKELETILDYPMSMLEVVEDYVVAELGVCVGQYGRMTEATEHEVEVARQRIAPTVEIKAERPAAIRTKRGQAAAKRLAISYEAFLSAAIAWEAGERSPALANSLGVWSRAMIEAQKESGVDLRPRDRLKALELEAADYMAGLEQKAARA